MIYDCFTFFNELDLLEIRLNILNDVVDKFVLVESTKTYSGQEKELFFKNNKSRFSKFSDKIIHIVVDDMPEMPKVKNGDYWELEYFQRNAITRGLKNCKNEDIILISDLDEIPNPDKILKYKDYPGIKVFKQKMFVYYLNNLDLKEPCWANAKMLNYAEFIKNGSNPQKTRALKGNLIDNGGWHFTYVGGAEKVAQKIKSFTHVLQEKTINEYADINKVKERIDKGEFLYDEKSGKRFAGIKIDKSFPKYLIDNVNLKYNHLICKVNLTFFDKLVLFKNEIKCNILANIKNIMIPKLKKIVKKIIPSQQDNIKKILQRELSDCKSVLDLGCGESSPLRLLKGNPNFKDLYSVGVDIFSPYILKNVEENKIHSKYINQNIFEVDFPEKSFDCAIMLDVIEHFEREDFIKFLPKLEKFAKKIIIMTPNGFVKQESYDNNPYQVHKSGWTVPDMEKLGFKCLGMSGLKTIYDSNIKPTILKTLLINLSQIFFSKKPEMCFHIVCIKNN